jgi:D-serine deaminase-like pyridoxal phosphate-dependent protein
MDEIQLSQQHKAFPSESWGKTAVAFVAAAPALSTFQTPVLAVDDAAIQSNVATMAGWLAERGLEIAPHGKTTMAPSLWKRMLDAGAWGITLATPWQVQLARSAGVSRILLANELVDPVALRWLAAELGAHPGFEFVCWADSVDAVRIMERELVAVGATRPVDVLVELGGQDGRTGARGVDAALEVASVIASSSRLRLAGVGGYEGALAHDRSDAATARVRDYLRQLVDLNSRLATAGQYGELTPIVTAGGSAYFDLVAEAFAPLVSKATLLLRSGAYQVHDDGFYLGISPLTGTDAPFRSAIHAWVRVLSRPEPNLAIFDAGKRDLPYDEGMPVAQLIHGVEDSARILAGSSVTKLNDQHGFLRLPGASAKDVPVGSVIRLGLSHPCTAFDKWRLLPLVDGSQRFDARVVGVVETFF